MIFLLKLKNSVAQMRGNKMQDTFPPRIVCKVTGIVPGTLGMWAARGILKSFDGISTIKGRPRRYTLADALALGVVKCASKVSALSDALASLAHKAAHEWLDNNQNAKISTIIFYFNGGQRMAIGPIEKTENEQMRHTFDTSLIFSSIFARISQVDCPCSRGRQPLNNERVQP